MPNLTAIDLFVYLLCCTSILLQQAFYITLTSPEEFVINQGVGGGGPDFGEQSIDNDALAPTCVHYVLFVCKRAYNAVYMCVAQYDYMCAQARDMCVLLACFASQSN